MTKPYPSVPIYEQSQPWEPFAGAAIFGIIGGVVGFIYNIATFENFKPKDSVLPDLGSDIMTFAMIGAGIGLVIGFLSYRGVESRNAAKRKAYEDALQEIADEKAQRVEQARRQYVDSYNAYLPKWQAWRTAYQAYTPKLTAFETWERNRSTAFNTVRPRVQQAVEAFKVLHFNVDKRARLELELSSPDHRLALFREAFAEAAKGQPDFGYFRLLDTNPALAAQIPELMTLKGDPRLMAVRSHLPPKPALARELTEAKQPPAEPQRPAPPGNLLFSSGGGIDAAPVPPDKVTFTPN